MAMASTDGQDLEDTTEVVNTRGEALALSAIALPLACTYLAEVAMVYTDKVIVGRLGSVELAAAGLAGDLMIELILLAIGPLSIVGVLAAQAHGARRPDRVGLVSGQGMLLAVALAIPVTLISLNLDWVMVHTDQDPLILQPAREYLFAVSWCILPTMLFITLRYFVTALSRTRDMLIITVLAVPLNLGLNVVLVFGGFGIPALGVAGAGWGSTIVAWLMFIALAACVVRQAAFRGYSVFGEMARFDWKIWRNLLSLGLPVTGITAIEGGMFVAIAILMGTFGAEALAANQIVMTWTMTAFVFALGLGEAATIRVAQNVGAGLPLAARRAGFVGIALCVVVIGALTAVPLLAPEAMVRLFLGDSMSAEEAAVVLPLAVSLFTIVALFQVFDGLQAVALRALRGLGDVRRPMWMAAFGYWVLGVGGGVLLAFPLGLEGVGLWWGLALGLFVTALLLIARFNRRSRGALVPLAEGVAA